MTDKMDTISTAILARAININYVIVASLLLLLVAALLKLAGKSEIEIMKVPINLRYVQLVILAMTVAHLFTAISFNLKVNEILLKAGDEKARIAYDNLRDNGPLFFQGLVSRLRYVQGPFGPVFLMSYSDPTTWLAHGVAIASFVTMIHWKGLSIVSRITSTAGSGVLVVINWLIGGGWAIHASCLSAPDVCRVMLGL